MALAKAETLATARAWKKANLARVREYRKQYYAKHRRRELRMMAAWQATNRETNLARRRVVYALNPEPDRLRKRSFLQSERGKKWMRDSANRRYATDRSFRIKSCLRASIIQALRLQRAGRKTACTLELTGCSMAELVAHLKKKFTAGMSWANYGKWHIDHVRPCASFDLSDPAQQRACFHYMNLQPLWALDNHRKGARWTGSSVLPKPVL